MGILDRIVDINITRETRGVASANFSTPILVTKTATARVATFASAKEVSDAGYSDTSVEYQGALAHFSQDNYPPFFKIGQWDETAPETLSEALDAIIATDNDWYGIALGHVDTVADYTTTAVWAKTNGKFLFAGDAGSANEMTTALNGAQANKACVINNSKLRETSITVDFPTLTLGYADVAFMSSILGKQIGSYTADYTALKSTFVDTFTTTEITNIFNDNGNLFHSFYSKNIVEEGRVTDGNTPRNGEWIDIEIGLDWLEVRMQEAVFLTIVGADKIPYTDEGTATLATAVEGVLIQAQKQGLISEYSIEREPTSEQTTQDKADRKYNGISWDATLAGAIHTTTINGTVRV